MDFNCFSGRNVIPQSQVSWAVPPIKCAYAIVRHSLRPRQKMKNGEKCVHVRKGSKGSKMHNVQIPIKKGEDLMQ